MALIDNIIRFFNCEDNAASTVVIDATGTSNGVSSTNTSNLNTTGKIGDGFNFTAANSEEVTTDASFTSTAALTFNIWVKTSTNGEQDLIGFRSATGGSDTLTYIQFQPNNILRFRIRRGAVLDLSFDYDDGNWHMYTLTYDGSSTGEAWIDGVSKGAVTVGTNTGSRNISFGRMFNLLSLFLNGDVDLVLIADAVKSDADIASLYNGGAGLNPFAAATTRLIKIAGTFQAKPILTKVAGTFVDKPIKIKVGGTFQ